MSYELKLSPRLLVLVRVFTDSGEIVEHLARSVGAALGFVRYCSNEGYWYGKPIHIEYEYYSGYRGD